MFSSLLRVTRGAVYIACLTTAAFVQPTPADSRELPQSFRWLNRTKDARLWVRIQAAFATELKSDAMSGDDSSRRFAKKFIQRIGLYDSSALVIVGLQEPPSPQQTTLFEAYNYSLLAEKKGKIAGEDSENLWQLRILKQAKLEESPIPDIVFSYKDCWECESVTLLGSFLYSPKDSAWALRPWGSEEVNKKPLSLEIDADIDTGSIGGVDVEIETKCAYRIADFNGDGLDDIADWCRVSYVQMDPPHKEISTENRVILFTLKGGSFSLAEVADKEEIHRLRKQICSIQPKKAPCNTLPM